MEQVGIQVCQVKSCGQPAEIKATYDCGTDPDQELCFCKNCYENSHDELPNGKKFFYFKEFVKKVEFLKEGIAA